MQKANRAHYTIEDYLREAGSPPVHIHTYLYLDTEDQVRAMELPPHWRASPQDESESIGYAHAFMRQP